MKILDPRFHYVPAVATDVSQTWKRFGFSAQANEARRARWQSRLQAMKLSANARCWINDCLTAKRVGLPQPLG